MNELAKINQEHKLPAINSEKELPTPLWIEHWRPEYGTDDVGKAREALPVWEAALAPMDRKEIAVLLAKWILPFSPPDNWNDTAPIYIEEFEEMPAGLVEEAMRSVALNFRWGFPKPGDYRACVEAEWKRRKRIFFNLKGLISTHERKEAFRKAHNTPALVGKND